MKKITETELSTVSGGTGLPLIYVNLDHNAIASGGSQAASADRGSSVKQAGGNLFDVDFTQYVGNTLGFIMPA